MASPAFSASTTFVPRGSMINSMQKSLLQCFTSTNERSRPAIQKLLTFPAHVELSKYAGASTSALISSKLQNSVVELLDGDQFSWGLPLLTSAASTLLNDGHGGSEFGGNIDKHDGNATLTDAKTAVDCASTATDGDGAAPIVTYGECHDGGSSTGMTSISVDERTKAGVQGAYIPDHDEQINSASASASNGGEQCNSACASNGRHSNQVEPLRPSNGMSHVVTSSSHDYMEQPARSAAAMSNGQQGEQLCAQASSTSSARGGPNTSVDEHVMAGMVSAASNHEQIGAVGTISNGRWCSTESRPASAREVVDAGVRSDDAGVSRLSTSTSNVTRAPVAAAPTAVVPSTADQEGLSWIDVVHWLGKGGALLSFTWATVTLSGFGSYMPSQALWLCWGISVVTPMVASGVRPSWKVIWRYLQSCEALHNIPTQPVGAGESPGILLKLTLALALCPTLVNWTPEDVSVACRQYGCPRRCRESLQALVIIVFLLEGLPAIVIRLGDVVNRYSSWHCVLCSVWQTGFYDILVGLVQEEDTRLQSYQSSALSHVIFFMGCLLLGGNFGNYTTKRCYWLLWTIVIAEMIAEAIYRFPLMRRRGSMSSESVVDVEAQQDPIESPQRPRSGWQHKATDSFRGLVLGSLSIMLIIFVSNNAFYPADLPNEICDETCRRNTKVLLSVACYCAISQAVSLAPVQILSALILLPLLLYSALAAGLVVALAACVAGVAIPVVIFYGVWRAFTCVLYKLGDVDLRFYKRKRIMVPVILLLLTFVILSCVKHEWPWFMAKQWLVPIGHFFRRLWKGMSHDPSTSVAP